MNRLKERGKIGEAIRLRITSFARGETLVFQTTGLVVYPKEREHCYGWGIVKFLKHHALLKSMINVHFAMKTRLEQERRKHFGLTNSMFDSRQKKQGASRLVDLDRYSSSPSASPWPFVLLFVQ